MKNNIIITIVVAIIFGTVGFFAGTKYQSSRRSTSNDSPFGFFGNDRFNRFGNRQNSNPQITGQSQNGNRMSGPQMVAGEILSQDDKSITVKLQDGSSKIVLFSDKTVINKADQATKNDLKTGQKVAVFGQENSDGSVTAQNIQLNPTFGFGAGANRPSQP